MGHKQRIVGVSKAEAHLVAALRKALINEGDPSRRRTVYAVELDSFQGVADLVIGEFNGHGLLPSGVPRTRLKMFSLSTAKVLATLDGRKTARISEIAENSALSEKTVRGELRTLKDARIVDIGEGGRVRVVHDVTPPFAEVVAYEVKVKDWKSGLRQARSYKSFANRTYLALPIDRAESVQKQREIFRLFNVGLVGVGKRGRLRWFAKTRRSRPISPARNFYASVLLLKKAPLVLFKSSGLPWPSPRHRPNSEGERARFAARK